VTALDNLSRTETLASTSASRDTAGYNWTYLREHHPNVTLLEGDIRDFDLLREVVQNQDAVIHTAGQVAVTASLEDPRTDFEVNARGTFNVLEAARQAEGNPAVVMASTNKVYGDNVNRIPVREQKTRYEFGDPEYKAGVPETLSVDDCEHTPYGTSKLAGDLYVQDYAARGIVDAAAFRMSCIFGPHQFGAEDQGWVAHFVISAIKDELLTVFGDGKQVRDVLYIDDLLRAYHAFLADPVGKSAIYNIGGGPSHTTSLLELLDLIETVYGLSPSVEFANWREGDQRVYISDISRVNAELNWEPTINLDTGIRQFIDWYQNR
jgi:CDP-paratose 2-epimerase